MEDRLWPAGDWHWGIVAVAGLLVAFSPDIYDRLRSCWRKPEGRWITVGAVSSAVSWVVYLPQVNVEWVRAVAFALALISTGTIIVYGAGVAMNWLWRRTHSTGKAHKVSAGPVRFHFSVPEASGTLRPAPWCKRVWRRVLNEIKAWGEAGER